MPSDAKKEFIRNYLADVSGRSKPRELLAKYMDDEELIKHIENTERAFPEYRYDPVEIVADGDIVSVRGTMSGVNRGEFKGNPPTNRKVSISAFVAYRVVDDRILEHWMLADNLELLRQLGLLKELTKQG